MSEDMNALALEQLHALNGDIKVVVIHPRYVQQHALLNYFINTPMTVYLRLCGRVYTGDELAQTVQQEVLHQTSSTDFGAIHALVIDECDCVEPEILAAYLHVILPTLHNGRVILLGRDVPLGLMADEVLRAQCAFIPTDTDLLMRDYVSGVQVEKTLLEVSAFGYGQVVVNGKTIKRWDGALPRALFFYLVDRGMATRQDIFSTLWPTLSERDATNVFHVTKRKVNEILEFDFTEYASGFYRISPRVELVYDVIRFTELAQASEVAPSDEAERTLLQAMALYKGHYLVDLQMGWVNQRRYELKQLYVDALVRQAEIQEERRQVQKALGLYTRAYACARYREDVAFRVMSLYETLGMVQDALAVYDQLREALASEQGIAPNYQLANYAQGLRQELSASV